tara:strand:- start:1453 stop:1974 length:522 start_codon:yes stop_codon:yes gene_type:complete
MNDKTKPIEISTQSRIMHYRKRWHKAWWYAINGTVQMCLIYLWDEADPIGIVDPDNIMGFNYTVIKKEDRFLEPEYVLKEANKLRKQIRVLDNGMWLLEDYFRVQRDTVVFDVSLGSGKNDKTTGPIKGMHRSCLKNGLDPATIRGVLEYKAPDIQKQIDKQINDDNDKHMNS